MRIAFPGAKRHLVFISNDVSKIIRKNFLCIENSSCLWKYFSLQFRLITTNLRITQNKRPT